MEPNTQPNRTIKKTDGCIHDSNAMGPDGVGYVSDVDGIQVFVIACSLNKDLKQTFIYKYKLEDI